MLIKDLYLADISYLGVPEKHRINRAYCSVEDNALCECMRHIGVTWWHIRDRWLEMPCELEE